MRIESPILRGAGALALLLLIGAQFFPAERTNPPVKAEIVAPPEVKALLERSCFDCHSNRTRWPWYAYVAPMSWYVTDHVRHARGELNMTEWPLLDLESQQYLLSSMKGELKAKEMPLKSYLLVHWNARLSDEERLQLILWLDEEVALLSGWGGG